MTIYIVSGYMRSGTSMMMECLIAGGMDAAYSVERNALATHKSDEHYSPNANGLYEIPLREYNEPDFPLKYQGKLIKVMVWGLRNLAVNPEGYRIVLMRRDPEEIKQSCYAFFGKPCRDNFIADYHANMDRAVSQMRNRRDVDLAVFQYREVVGDPVHWLTELDWKGWPVPEIGAAINSIDPSKCRYRRETLTPGVCG